MSKGSSKLKAKGRRVMHEFSRGTLRSSSGELVTDRDQALAIAFSEQERAAKKRRNRRLTV